MKLDNITGTAKEVKELSEIADVTFENNRLVLRIDNPMAARKFGLSDNTWRYEFDGGSMYWYDSEDENKPKTWSCSCGRGSWTLVGNDTSKQIRTVKDEMVKQIRLKGMLSYFGNNKAFTDVAIELNAYFYKQNGSLKERSEA